MFFRRIIVNDGVPTPGNWEDAFVTYGISFTDASLSRLITPAPSKEVIENKSRLQHGKRIVRNPKYVRTDERSVTLEMHIKAPNKILFWERYSYFCKNYLEAGFIDIYHRDFINIDTGMPYVFRMTYVSCDEFTEFMQQLARFNLTLNEPDPTNRGTEDKWASET